MTPSLLEVPLLPGVDAWFTGRAASAPAPSSGRVRPGRVGNLSHRRPHLPEELARARQAVCAGMGLEVIDLHLMRQVHGAAVGRVDAQTPRGAELRGVDALVTVEPGRALAVQVADCVPLLLASGRGPVAAVHAGRRGLAAGIVDATLRALADLGAPPHSLRAAIGPAIGGCCYEVPAALRDRVAAAHPRASGVTTWGTPSLDLPAAVEARLRSWGVAAVLPSPGCTRCDPDRRWFSHRADPGAGRQLGVVVRVAEVVAA